MSSVKVYNMSGKVVGEQALPARLFAVPVKADVVHQVMVAQQANSRQAIAHTKTKGEVRGGGRKPWKQKGTGRARQGSIRNPQWRGGGIAFGPRSNRNFSLKVNKTMKQAALAMVLTDKVMNDRLVVLDQFTVPAAKTKQLRDALKALPSGSSKTLLSLGEMDTNVVRAANNLSKLGFCSADSLNIVDLLNYEYLVIDQAAIAKMEKQFSKAKAKDGKEAKPKATKTKKGKK